MDIATIRAAIGATALIAWVHDESYPAKWSLQFKDGASRRLTFRYLGGGSNKLVFQILEDGANSGYTLAFQARPNDEDKEKDVRDEVEILRRLAEHNVLVPKPIATDPSATDHVFSFEIENYDCDKEGTVYGYIMEYFGIVTKDNPEARYLEMTKFEGDLPNWMEKRVLSAMPNAKTYLETTIKTFNLIKAEFEREPWGDFQVIYDTTDGRLVVFDPYSDTSNKAKTIAILEKWQEDLENAS